MKTLLTIAMIFFISCNDHKDPPDDGLERIAKVDSLRTDSLINKP
jgi:hypothetical protein